MVGQGPDTLQLSFSSPSRLREGLLLKKREGERERGGLMRLADACVLLQSGELDILHRLCYKYPHDIYYTQKASGDKTFG